MQNTLAAIRPIARIAAALAVLLPTAGAPSLGSAADTGAPSCETFFDKWNEPGIPESLLAMLGLGHELASAKDCLDKKDIPTACKHWSKAVEVFGKLGPSFEKERAGVEKLMQDNECETTSGGEPDGEVAQ